MGAQRLGKAVESCVVLEDAPGVAAAKAAGMRVIGVTTTHSREELDCLVVVDRLSDLCIQVGRQAGNRLKIQIE